jgi:hypothetical protein
VILDIEPPNKPPNVEKEEACTIEGSTMSQKYFHISMRKILNSTHYSSNDLLAYLLQRYNFLKSLPFWNGAKLHISWDVGFMFIANLQSRIELHHFL